MVSKLVLAVFVLAAQDSPRAGTPFALPVGESRSIEDFDLVVGFSAVTRDSRCPKDVNCIVAGEALVLFEVTASGESAELHFRIPPGGTDQAELSSFRVSILELAPEPVSGERMDPASYVATVLVEPCSN